MKKNIITAFGLVSLVVLSYVGIAQLKSKDDVVHEPDAMEIEQEDDLAAHPAESIKSEPSKDEKSDYVLLDSGLKYKITKEGMGYTPILGQTVHVHYSGWLDENKKPGTEFDSSYNRGTPLVFEVGRGRVIPGWIKPSC